MSRSSCCRPSTVLAFACRGVSVGLQQLSHRGRRHLMPGGGQRGGQVRGGFRRPPKRRHRITPGHRIHQSIQRIPQRRVDDLGCASPGTWATHPTGNRLRVVQLPDPLRHRIRVRTNRFRDRLDPAAAQHLRLRAQQQPPRPLIQMRPDQQQPRRKYININPGQRHTTILPNRNGQTYVIARQALS